MTVSELAKWLADFEDQDAIVEVVVNARGYGCDDYVASETFDPSKHADYTDFRGSPYAKPGEAYYNKRILVLGQE